jgi:hypothetical protein
MLCLGWMKRAGSMSDLHEPRLQDFSSTDVPVVGCSIGRKLTLKEKHDLRGCCKPDACQKLVTNDSSDVH